MQGSAYDRSGADLALSPTRDESSVDQLALIATPNCLMGCASGEIMGMAIGTALGFSNLATIALAVALAFVFGFALTSVPLLRSGLALAVVIPIAVAADTVSITIMEVIDNAFVIVVPGAMRRRARRRSPLGVDGRWLRSCVRPRVPGELRKHPAWQGLLPGLADA